ncbi:MAG: glycosyltransferase family 4 protein [Clostridia bacterium]|nr:glycosyltransferase family 4 protein [Clostridia bacterium]
MNKRVLMMTNHFISLYLFRKELIQRLCEDDYEVYLSIPHDERNDYFRNMGCKVIEAPVDRRGVNPLRDAVLAARYIGYMRRLKPACALSYTAKPNIYGALAARITRTKQICNITGTGGTFLRETVLAKLLRFLYRISVKHAELVYFQNEGDRDYFMHHSMVEDNFDMIPGSGVNLEEHYAAPYPESEDVIFLFSSRIYGIKGVDEFLKCAEIIKAKYPRVRFLAAGAVEDPERGKEMERYEKSGIIEYLGFCSDVKELLHKCHCVVLPSHGGEGIPNSILEASATARCVIASRVSGCRDVVEDGVTGYLFEPGNAQDFADKAERFINLPHEEKRQMGLRGRERAEKFFDRRTVLDKYYSKIQEYCGVLQ